MPVIQSIDNNNNFSFCEVTFADLDKFYFGSGENNFLKLLIIIRNVRRLSLHILNEERPSHSKQGRIILIEPKGGHILFDSFQ